MATNPWWPTTMPIATGVSDASARTLATTYEGTELYIGRSPDR